MQETIFFKQAELLLRILPLILKEEVFALKGGTAINFFVQELPRLSVDIDLTYLPVNERDVALNEISDRLLLISGRIKHGIPGAGITSKIVHGTEVVKGLIVEREGVTVKVEPNLVIRGSVYPPEIKPLVKKAQNLFELSLQGRILSPHDLYAGKFCAALDRQHPRDLFDVHLLLKNEGINPEMRKVFIVYMISHPRPMVEILSPQKKDIRDVFEKEFKGMITKEIPFEVLEKTINELVETFREEFTRDERKFIVSVKEGHPRWDLLAIEGVEDLPAVKWKLLNISKMDPAKHRKAVNKLRDYLGV